MEDRERAKNGTKEDAHLSKYDINIFDSISVCRAIPDKKILDDPLYQSIYLLQILVFIIFAIDVIKFWESEDFFLAFFIIYLIVFF